MKAPVFSSGKRAVLRVPADEDAAFFARLRNDVPLQMQLMALPRPNSLRRVREWLAHANQDERRVLLVIASRRGGRALGYTQLAQIEPLHRTAELGICLAREAQGRGLGAEAMGLLEAYAAGVLGLRKLTLRVLGGNTAAVRLYRRLGYREVGTLREQFWQAGKFCDVVLMEKFLAPGSSAPKRRSA